MTLEQQLDKQLHYAASISLLSDMLKHKMITREQFETQRDKEADKYDQFEEDKHIDNQSGIL